MRNPEFTTQTENNRALKLWLLDFIEQSVAFQQEAAGKWFGNFNLPEYAAALQTYKQNDIALINGYLQNVGGLQGIYNERRVVYTGWFGIDPDDATKHLWMSPQINRTAPLSVEASAALQEMRDLLQQEHA